MAVVLPRVLPQPCTPGLDLTTLRSAGGAKHWTDAAYMQMSTDRITTFEAQNALLCPRNGNALRPKLVLVSYRPVAGFLCRGTGEPASRWRYWH